jgi:hypothetical protein
MPEKDPSFWAAISLSIYDARLYGMSLVIGLAAYLHRVNTKVIEHNWVSFFAHILTAATSAYIAAKLLSWFNINGDLQTALVGIATWSGDHALHLAEKVISHKIKEWTGDCDCEEQREKHDRHNHPGRRQSDRVSSSNEINININTEVDANNGDQRRN